MGPPLAALIVHDLKNGLGALEAQLLTLQHSLEGKGAEVPYKHCVELRQRFVQFLALYGVDGHMRAHSADESPQDLIRLICKDQGLLLEPLSLCARDLEQAPAYWYFDRRLVRLALEAALHNAQRYARRGIELSAQCRDGMLVFVIDDDGPGPQPPNPDDPQSTGLGTSLCQAVASAHDLKGRRGFARLLARPEGGARFELGLA
ncbi:MAG: sensor histidine kinase [Ideonella sp.]|nr:sensor histidine kinase [Ideonella sp.]